MPINLLNEMHRDKTVEKVLTPHIGEPLTRELFDRLGSALVMENYMRRLREARLTGNWIVFSKRNGANKYLTLADHNEGDAIIAERINRYQAFDLQSGWRSDEPLALERPLLSAQNATVSG
jgi:hypothetical protein